LGARFTAAVYRVVEQAALNPRRYAAVYGDIREGIVQGFPFCVYYKVDGAQLVVLAVFHASRDPSIWQACD
jgi:plasmid stabilization system protein ParE